MLFRRFPGSINKSLADSKKLADEESKKLKSMMHPGVSEANLLDYNLLSDKVK